MNSQAEHIATTIKAFKAIAFTIVLGVLPVFCYAGSPYNSIASAIVRGNWTSSSSWASGNTPPSSGFAMNDQVNINYTSPQSIILNGSLNLGSSGSNVSINISSGDTLIVTGNVTIDGGSNNNISSGGVLIVGGNLVNNGNISNSGVIVVIGNFDNESTINNGNTYYFGTLVNAGSGSTTQKNQSGFNSDFASSTNTYKSVNSLIPTVYTYTSNNASTYFIVKSSTYVYFTEIDNTLGKISNSGNMYLSGNFNNSGDTISGSGGTIFFNGSTSIGGSTASKFVNVNIGSGKTFVAPSAMTVKGNWTNSGGTFTNSSGTVTFSGSSGSQTISKTGGETFYNLTINNTGSGVSLGSNITVNGTLTMTNGIITTTSSDTITLGSTASIGETASSYVTGNVQTTRSIGSSTNNTFGGLGVEINETHSSNSTKVIRTTGTACTAANGKSGIKRYFTITPANDAGLSGTMVFHYLDAELNGCTEANLKLYKSTDSRVTWHKQSSPLTLASNYMTLNNITSFSDWTASDSVNETLPIELTNFDVVIQNNIANITWTTATETNNDYFTIERSTDGIHWVTIYTCDGAGTSTEVHNYFCDIESLQGTSYFRLEQTDINGNFTYSDIVSAGNAYKTYFSQITIFPNPNDGKILNISGLKDSMTNVTIVNSNGSQVYKTTIQLDGYMTVVLDLDKKLNPDVYVVKCVSNSQVYTQQLIVK